MADNNRHIAKEIIRILNEANVTQYYEIGRFWEIWDKEYGLVSMSKMFREYFDLVSEIFNKPMPVAWITKWICIFWLYAIYCRLKNSYGTKDIIYFYDVNGMLVKADLSKMSNVAAHEKLKRFLKKTSKKAAEDIPILAPVNLIHNLQHYWNYNYSEIFDYDFNPYKTPNEVFADLEEIVVSKRSKHAHMVDERKEKEKYGERMHDFLTFPDGWKWILKETSSCRFEQEFGGHCGTALDSDEHILSLREPSKDKHFYKIWASFSIDSGGIIRYRSGTVDVLDEKGRIKERKGNQKPEKFTHPYIYKLLMDDRIKGLRLEEYSYSDDIQIEDFEGDMKKNLENKFSKKQQKFSIYAFGNIWTEDPVDADEVKDWLIDALDYSIESGTDDYYHNSISTIITIDDIFEMGLLDLDYKKLENTLREHYGEEFDLEDDFYDFYKRARDFFYDNYGILKDVIDSRYYRDILRNIPNCDIDEVFRVASEIESLDIFVNARDESNILYAKDADI